MASQQEVSLALNRVVLNLENRQSYLYGCMIILFVISMGSLFLVNGFENEFTIFIVLLTTFALPLWALHYLLVKKPILKSIQLYIDRLKNIALSGDELIQQQLIPNDRSLRAISRYSPGLQFKIQSILYRGMSHLNFLQDYPVESPYHQVVLIIRELQDAVDTDHH
ncbi:MAG: hypothetical protein KF763_17185 [Cyclobacteriaceae bacterium]|nr:hypothetical protein [Cyclobacteriaceae bacterium]